jgi:hypothetical protein
MLLRTYRTIKEAFMTDKVKLDVFWDNSESKFLQNAVQAAIKVFRERSISGLGGEACQRPPTFAAVSRDDA